MTCYHPIKGYRSKALTVNGKRKLVFDVKLSDYGIPMEIACGQCIGCRLKRSSEWATRISQEASLYEKNCFITLTYAPEHLPSDGSLHVRDFQLFLKRLRKKYGSKIRFFHCGEYGENLGRPHYHACLMNFDFPDKIVHRQTSIGDIVWRSPSLEELWPFGYSEIGSVTFESAAYVARYITKKINGSQAESHYMRIDPETGEITQLKPEYTTMSRRPGIGQPWLDKFSSDVYPHDSITLRGGAKLPPPKYYNNRYEVMHPEKYALVKLARESNPVSFYGTDEYKRRAIENTDERLKVREIVQCRTIETLKRQMEK